MKRMIQGPNEERGRQERLYKAHGDDGSKADQA